MSIEECLKEAKKERRAEGMVEGERVKIDLAKSAFGGFLTGSWVVWVFAYGKRTGKYFRRRSSADNYFEKLLRTYGLNIQGDKVKDVEV